MIADNIGVKRMIWKHAGAGMNGKQKREYFFFHCWIYYYTPRDDHQQINAALYNVTYTIET